MNPVTTKISGAQLAEQLLGVGGQPRNIDHLIEELRPTTQTGWEGPLLEFKATYFPSPKFPDDPDNSQPDFFIWNVLHAFIAFANAIGGCVVLGIKESNGELFEGDWDPTGILQKDNREEKDLESHVRKLFFRANGNEAKRLSFACNKTKYSFCISKDNLSRLEKLIRFYCCRSQKLSCNAIVAIVQPIPKNAVPIDVTRAQNQVRESVTYYRSPTVAKTLEIKDVTQLMAYWQAREPENAICTDILNRPFKRAPIEQSHFSTVLAPNPDFLGREGELAHLHELCAAGKIPLIHAAGGTGKTQLALKYAELHAKDYPGGRFYVPSENAESWEEALTELIAPFQSTIGISARKLLKLKTSGNIAIADIINALIRRSREVGKILLIVDNVVKPTAFFADEKLVKTFPPDFTSSIAVVATSRTAKGIRHRAFYAKCISLGDLTQEEASALLTGGEPFASEQERIAAAGIIEILGNRALYIHRMARIVDDSARHPYKRLYDKLRQDLLHAIRPQEDDDNPDQPEVLWQYVRNRVLETPTGKVDIRLAQAIALFPVDGADRRILEALWYSEFGKLGQQETLNAYCEDPDLFADALKRLSEYSLIQYAPNERIVRMHRLDRAAIQQQVLADASGWIRTIGEFLKSCPCVEAKDWVNLAKTESTLFDFCPLDILDESCWIVILARAPRYRHLNVPWENFSQTAWTWLLSRRPEFVDNPHLDKRYIPQNILTVQPSLARCFPLADLSGKVWAKLVIANPALAPQCPWNRFRRADWRKVIECRPEYIRYCHHLEMLQTDSTLIDDEVEHDVLDEKDNLYFPYFLRHILECGDTSLAILSGRQPKVFPELLKFENDTTNIKRKISISNLYRCPQRLDFFIEDYEDDFDPEAEHKATGDKINILWLCEERLEARLDMLSPNQRMPLSWKQDLEPKELALLLCVRPDFGAECDWTRFKSRELALILVNRPSLASFCDWSKITGRDWATLLDENPGFAEHCDWSKLSDDDWAYLLNGRPWMVAQKPRS